MYVYIKKITTMKTTKAILSLFIILTSFGLSKLNAQENLWRWVEKYKKDTSIDVTIITNNNPESKKVDKEIYSIVISDSPKIIDELINAYNKDKQNAYSHSERRSKGKDVSYHCVFKNKDINETFSFSFGRANSVTLSIIKSYSTNRGFDFHSYRGGSRS